MTTSQQQQLNSLTGLFLQIEGVIDAIAYVDEDTDHANAPQIRDMRAALLWVASDLVTRAKDEIETLEKNVRRTAQ